MQRIQQNLRSIGVAVGADSMPETGEPTFVLPDDEFEIGMGAHGEPGVERRKMMSADDLGREMIQHIIDDLPYQ